MERTVDKSNLKTCNRESTEYTSLQAVLESLLYSRDEFLRYVTTLNLVNKLKVALLVVNLWLTFAIFFAISHTINDIFLVDISVVCFQNCKKERNLLLFLSFLFLAIFFYLTGINPSKL